MWQVPSLHDITQVESMQGLSVSIKLIIALRKTYLWQVSPLHDVTQVESWASQAAVGRQGPHGAGGVQFPFTVGGQNPCQTLVRGSSLLCSIAVPFNRFELLHNCGQNVDIEGCTNSFTVAVLVVTWCFTPR